MRDRPQKESEDGIEGKLSRIEDDRKTRCQREDVVVMGLEGKFTVKMMWVDFE